MDTRNYRRGDLPQKHGLADQAVRDKLPFLAPSVWFTVRDALQLVRAIVSVDVPPQKEVSRCVAPWFLETLLQSYPHRVARHKHGSWRGCSSHPEPLQAAHTRVQHVPSS